MVDMHIPSSKIKEVMEFQIRLNVMQNVEKWSANGDLSALFGPLKQILTNLNNFYIFVYM
jgi:hypothetical protein